MHFAIVQGCMLVCQSDELRWAHAATVWEARPLERNLSCTTLTKTLCTESCLAPDSAVVEAMKLLVEPDCIHITEFMHFDPTSVKRIHRLLPS